MPKYTEMVYSGVSRKNENTIFNENSNRSFLMVFVSRAFNQVTETLVWQILESSNFIVCSSCPFRCLNLVFYNDSKNQLLVQNFSVFWNGLFSVRVFRVRSISLVNWGVVLCHYQPLQLSTNQLFIVTKCNGN